MLFWKIVSAVLYFVLRDLYRTWNFCCLFSPVFKNIKAVIPAGLLLMPPDHVLSLLSLKILS